MTLPTYILMTPNLKDIFVRNCTFKGLICNSNFICAYTDVFAGRYMQNLL